VGIKLDPPSSPGAVLMMCLFLGLCPWMVILISDNNQGRFTEVKTKLFW
jgi:hypothetical protein